MRKPTYQGGEIYKMVSKFDVYRVGGSLGELDNQDTKMINGRRGVLVQSFPTKSEALAFAQHRRSMLSKGERSYYKIGYRVIEVRC